MPHGRLRARPSLFLTASCASREGPIHAVGVIASQAATSFANAPGSSGTRTDLQLGVRVAEVRLHRLLRHEQRLGDLAVAHPVGGQLRDAALARGQRVDPADRRWAGRGSRRLSGSRSSPPPKVQGYVVGVPGWCARGARRRMNPPRQLPTREPTMTIQHTPTQTGVTASTARSITRSHARRRIGERDARRMVAGAGGRGCRAGCRRGDARWRAGGVGGSAHPGQRARGRRRHPRSERVLGSRRGGMSTATAMTM